jgi:hypothetical protein
MGKLINFKRPGTNADPPSFSVWINPKAPAWLPQLIFKALAQAMESPESSRPPDGREISPSEGAEEGPGPGF